MPIYMDVHIVPGVKAKAVAEAHSRDVLVQEEHACKCMTYWVDELRESVFCLIEAPNKEAVVAMHNQAHGLIPHKIIEVNSGVVEAFLGRIYDPEGAEISEAGLKVFSDPSFRILVVTQTADPVLLKHRMGAPKTAALLTGHNQVIRKNMAQFGGREVEGEEGGFVISFTSATKAVSCALAIQKDMPLADAEALQFKISINAGEPVAEGNHLFENTLQLAQHICGVPRNCPVALSASVKKLVAKDFPEDGNKPFLALSPQDEAILQTLYRQLHQHWQNPDFGIDEYCRAMAMSKSQLYRKSIALTGFSPNLLLKEYRLEQAKKLMKKQFYNIAQITFDTGFTSPSYFTKCFKKKYGLLPMSYMEMLHN